MDEKKPLEDWTLGECKAYCKGTLDCPNCLLAKVCGEHGFGLPENWPIGG